jgi:hypothetical protein
VLVYSIREVGKSLELGRDRDIQVRLGQGVELVVDVEDEGPRGGIYQDLVVEHALFPGELRGWGCEARETV